MVHVSEMDWTNKNIHPSKVVQLADDVEVMVLDIDEERRRISLGMKQCRNNPWDDFAENHKKGDHVTGKIKSITDFGIFIGLDGGIDGLVHLSDITWDETGEDVIRDFKKGQELETVVLSVDPERERISLGVKQLDKDPFSTFLATHEKGSVVTGTIKEVDARGAVVELAEGVDGYLRASEVSRERIEDARSVLKEGDKIEAKFTAVDRKNRALMLSIKGKDFDEEKATIASYSATSSGAGGGSFGDLLKDQLDANKDSE